ncbi:MAG: hypothetical protein ACTSVG_00800 [Alphaproteobacteria bacterium]
MSDVLAEVRTEIEALHDFFTGWFSGALTEDDETFARGLAYRMHPAYEMVLPSGAAHDLDGIVGAIRRAWGSAPDFRIEIHDVRVLGEWPNAGLVLARYIEAQTGARNTTPAENRRLSTALFERRGERLLWRYVHETALDGS